MSEQGWRDFLGAEGVEDWVVLHGGATALFVLPSLAAAARLALALADLPGFAESGALMTMTGDQLSVRLTRGVWRLESGHADLARAVSDVAKASGAVADRSRVQEVSWAVAARPDELDVGFWRTVLGYAALDTDNGVDPLGHGSTVWLQDLDPTKPLRHAMHVDVSVARERAQERLAAALAAGGRVVAEFDNPRCWVLADRAGNRVCLTAWPDGA